MRLVTLALCLLAISQPAHAELSATQLLVWYYRGDDFPKAYLAGLTQGIHWHMFTTKSRTYCPPGKLEITIDQFQSILKQRLTRYPGEGDDPAPSVMIRALKDAFPCN